jgi:hypothetical protein
VSRIADPFNGHIDAFRIAHVQRSDGGIETTWNNMSDPGAFAVAGPKSRKAVSRHRWPALVSSLPHGAPCRTAPPAWQSRRANRWLGVQASGL